MDGDKVIEVHQPVEEIGRMLTYLAERVSPAFEQVERRDAYPWKDEDGGIIGVRIVDRINYCPNYNSGYPETLKYLGSRSREFLLDDLRKETGLF